MQEKLLIGVTAGKHASGSGHQQREAPAGRGTCGERYHRGGTTPLARAAEMPTSVHGALVAVTY